MIEFVGPLPKGGRSRSNIFIMRLATINFSHMGEHLEKQGLFEIAFFVQTTVLGKILTLDNLRKRHVQGCTSVACVRRARNPSTIFFSIVKQLDQSFVGISFQSFRNKVGHASTSGGVSGQLKRPGWQALLYRCPEVGAFILMWCSQRERKTRNFKD